LAKFSWIEQRNAPLDSGVELRIMGWLDASQSAVRDREIELLVVGHAPGQRRHILDRVAGNSEDSIAAIGQN
jgi:hypothetical protein